MFVFEFLFSAACLFVLSAFGLEDTTTVERMANGISGMGRGGYTAFFSHADGVVWECLFYGDGTEQDRERERYRSGEVRGEERREGRKERGS